MFSKLSFVVTSTSFLFQVFYFFPEQQRQIKIIQRHLKIQDDIGSIVCDQGVKNPYKIDLRGWIETNKYD